MADSKTTYQPPFFLYMDLTGSWEEAAADRRIASNPKTGNYLYLDPNGILTDRYGNIGKPGDEEKMLARTKEDTVSHHRDNYYLRAGIDKLPTEIRAQLFDIAINGGPGRATDILGKVLAKAGNKYKGLSPEDAAAAYLNDVGMAKFNNDIAAERLAFYDELADRRPEKRRNLAGWHRRTAGFVMEKTPEEYKALGFKVENGKVMLPDQEIGKDGKPLAVLADGRTVDYNKWYWDNVLSKATNGQAKFDDRRRGTLRYTRKPTVAGEWGDDDTNAFVPLDEWSPADRLFFHLVMGFLNALFAPATPAQPTQIIAGGSSPHVFGQAAPPTPAAVTAQAPSRGAAVLS